MTATTPTVTIHVGNRFFRYERGRETEMLDVLAELYLECTLTIEQYGELAGQMNAHMLASFPGIVSFDMGD